MIYRETRLLAIVPPAPAVRKLDLQHTGKLKKKDNLVTEEGGA
jgi:hypothetical protein